LAHASLARVVLSYRAHLRGSIRALSPSSVLHGQRAASFRQAAAAAQELQPVGRYM